MSAPPVAATGSTRLWPSRDERLVPYCLIALGGLAATLVTGEPALAVLAAPFVLALALGLRRTGPIVVSARVTLDAEKVLEGDRVGGLIELEWGEPLQAHAVLHRLRGVAAAAREGSISWSPPAATRALAVPIELAATQWGRHAVGEVWLRLRAPFSLLAWRGRVVTGPALRVLPGSERLTRLLDPPDSHAVLGVHRSRRMGDGHEFAEIRAYAPGDRLRDLNWGATARYRQPFVNRHHRERSGDVVIAIDAFADGSAGSTAALARAARAGWAVASVHLRVNDRVGLAGLGDRARWLPPAGGRRAKYRLLETLLGIGGGADDADDQSGRSRSTVPASALVVALTPLHDQRTVRTLQAWRARGRSVVAVVIETGDLLGEPASAAEALARRLWSLELDRRRRELTGLGIPVVTVADDGPLAPVVSALRRARRAPARRRGR